MADLERQIKYTVDPSVQKVIEQLKAVTAHEQAVTKEMLNSGVAADKVAKQLKSITKEKKDLSTILRALGGDFKDQEQSVEQATSALAAYEDRLRAVQQGGADLSGDFASSTAGLRGAADVFTGGNSGALGGALEIGEAFADLGEFAPRLNAQLETLGQTMRSGDGATSKLVSSLGDGLASITGMSAGTASFVAVAAPAIAIVGGLALGIQHLNKIEQQRIEVIKAQAQAEEDVANLIAGGTTESDARARIQELQALEAEQQRILDNSQADYQAYLEGNQNAVQKISQGIAEGGAAVVRASFAPAQLFGFNIDDYINTADSAALVTKQLSGQEQALFEIEQERLANLKGTQAEIEELTQQLESGAFAANEAKEAEQELAQTREQVTAKLQAQYEQSIGRANQLQKQYADTIEATALQAKNAAELEAVQSQINQENELQRLKDHGDKLVEIRAAGNARIEQLEAEITSVGVERQKALSRIQNDGNKKLSDLQKEYQSRTQDSYQDFTQRLSRSTSDAAKSIRRLVEDINQSLDDATRSNDVEAFLRAQRDGETKLRRSREDASEQQARQIEDFVKGREKERQAFEEKQQAIRQGIEQEKREAIQAFAERRQALAEQIKIEKQAIQDRIAQEEASFAEQLRRDAVRAEQQARLEDERNRQQQQAHALRLQEIRQQAQAEQQASAAYLASIARIQQAANNINVNRQQAPAFSNFVNNNPFAQAAGNIYNAFTANTTVGDVASKRDVVDGVTQAATNIIKVISAATSAARNG